MNAAAAAKNSARIDGQNIVDRQREARKIQFTHGDGDVLPSRVPKKVAREAEGAGGFVNGNGPCWGGSSSAGGDLGVTAGEIDSSGATIRSCANSEVALDFQSATIDNGVSVRAAALDGDIVGNNGFSGRDGKGVGTDLVIGTAEDLEVREIKRGDGNTEIHREI